LAHARSVSASTTSAGARVAGRVYRALRSSRDLCAATYLGRDKAHRVARLTAARDADPVVFDDELSPAQIPGLFVVCSRGPLLLAPAATLPCFGRASFGRQAVST